MADDFRLEVDGLTDEIARLKLLGASVMDLRPLWPELSRLFVSWESRQFETEGVFMGTPWAPLTAEYAARKVVEHPGKGILVADGDLKRGATTPKRSASSEHTLILQIDWEKKGKKLDPAWHQRGTNKMPPRPLLADALTPEMSGELDAVIEDYAEGLLRRAGL